MRLWSIHPKYLDPTGLTACWREALLARKVLQGATKGYKNHPQLLRFKECSDPLQAIESYLHSILEESLRRGYNYDGSKVSGIAKLGLIPVTSGQLEYEFDHIKEKLSRRNPAAYARLLESKIIEPHPLFFEVEGEVEKWEIIR